MRGTVCGVTTLAGAGTAGLLIWVSTRISQGTLGGYWAVYGILAGAGLAVALSQLVGGWTKGGGPRISEPVLLIGFVPVLVAAGWVLLAGQPDANWFQRHTTSWSSDIGIDGLVDDLRGYLAVLAFGLGLALGFTFETSSARTRQSPRAATGTDDWQLPVAEPTLTETGVIAPQVEDREPEAPHVL